MLVYLYSLLESFLSSRSVTNDRDRRTTKAIKKQATDFDRDVM